MNKLIVKNPTDLELAVQIKGTRYAIAPMSQLANVPTEHAIHWKNLIHGFVILADDPVVDLEAEVKKLAEKKAEEKALAEAKKVAEKAKKEAEAKKLAEANTPNPTKNHVR